MWEMEQNECGQWIHDECIDVTVTDEEYVQVVLYED